MTDPANPLGHLPDPDKRYQVLGFHRGEMVFVEIADAEHPGNGIIVDYVSALGIASDINAEVVRYFHLLGRQALEDGTVDTDLETFNDDHERWHQRLWRRQSEN